MLCMPVAPLNARPVSNSAHAHRLLDKFENINDQPVCVAYVPPINMYWASGRFGRLLAFDPR